MLFRFTHHEKPIHPLRDPACPGTSREQIRTAIFLAVQPVAPTAVQSGCTDQATLSSTAIGSVRLRKSCQCRRSNGSMLRCLSLDLLQCTGTLLEFIVQLWGPVLLHGVSSSQFLLPACMRRRKIAGDRMLVFHLHVDDDKHHKCLCQARLCACFSSVRVEQRSSFTSSSFVQAAPSRMIIGPKDPGQ